MVGRQVHLGAPVEVIEDRAVERRLLPGHAGRDAGRILVPIQDEALAAQAPVVRLDVHESRLVVQLSRRREAQRNRPRLIGATAYRRLLRVVMEVARIDTGHGTKPRVAAERPGLVAEPLDVGVIDEAGGVEHAAVPGQRRGLRAVLAAAPGVRRNTRARIAGELVTRTSDERT